MESTMPSSSEKIAQTMAAELAAPPAIGHVMAHDDPDSPQNFPMHRKIYVSAASFAFGFVVAFGATAYTPGISEIMARFDVSMTAAILGLSLYLFGISFAPITTPHLSEKFGRSPIYFASIPLFSLFILGAGLSNTFAGIAICRFFAGFFGGPCLVLIEGTFADVWGSEVTGTYYSILGLSSYLGAGFGPLIGGFVFAARGYRWTQWITLMMALAAYLLGIGMPETYHRAVLKQRAKRHGIAPRIVPAQSGTTVGQMLQVTFLTPLAMMVTDPVVALTTINLGINFATIWQFFISVPAVLEGVYAFDVKQVGLAFSAAVCGSILAALSCIIIDRLTYPKQLARRQGNINAVVEYRLYPAMVGCFFVTASFFWIGWTAKPTVSWASPVLGTMLYVWGNLMVLIAMITYLFEAYPPKGTLSALTAAASTRLVLAAFLPLVIIQMITGLTGAWAMSLLGFFSAALIPIPFILFKWGSSMRARSKHGFEKTGTPVMMADDKDLERSVTN